MRSTMDYLVLPTYCLVDSSFFLNQISEHVKKPIICIVHTGMSCTDFENERIGCNDG